MYDVVIVGGGVSGSVAAIASARSGAKTLLIERYGFCGGTLTNSGVGPMMTFHAGEKLVIKGIPNEIVERLVQLNGSCGHIVDTTGYASSVTPFDSEKLKFVLDEMLVESGCALLYHSMLCGATVKNNKVTTVTICTKDGIKEISATIFIDATGDGDLSNYSGVAMKKGRDSDNLSQPMTANIKIGNVDIKKIRNQIEKNPENFRIEDINALKRSPRLSLAGFFTELENAKRIGEISYEREMVLFFETNNPDEVIVNMTRVLNKDACSSFDLTKAEIEGRAQAQQTYQFLKNRIIGFENSIMLSTGTQIGVRESRRIVGEYVLTENDILNSTDFPDKIAIGGYPIDIHNPNGNDTHSIHLKYGQEYAIPYRCLIPREIDNLIVCGRCISVTHEAGAAIRVTPIAMAIGQAAGTAGALSIIKKRIPRHLDIPFLIASLLKDNVYLGN